VPEGLAPRNSAITLRASFMGKKPALERRTVWFSGHVQGVGFRATVLHCARSFSVTGFVRNLDDGRVEMVAEGQMDELDRFVAAVAEELEQYIRQKTETRSVATGEFDSFGIQT
jgi:acylphosphatase